MANKIVVTSGKGGVGKTTVVANLGIALCDLGLRVALIDVDFGLNNLDVVLGVENKVVYDILDVFEGRCRIKQALIQCGEHKNLFVLPSGSAKGNNIISGQNLSVILENLSPLFDYILIDCPAGIDVGFHRAVCCADSALVVATPNLTSLRDADKVISILKSYRMQKISLIINRARGDLITGQKMMNPLDVQALLKTQLVGVLPEEDAVFLSVGNKLPKKCESKKAYKILASNLHIGNKKIFDVTCKYNGIFGSIRRGLKNKI
ncbi:MAG: septum site-determining protein MinD [Clostridia bacterium]|nr:septum site-determining protein MinD [Clostridia bacterium]